MVPGVATEVNRTIDPWLGADQLAWRRRRLLPTRLVFARFVLDYGRNPLDLVLGDLLVNGLARGPLPAALSLWFVLRPLTGQLVP